MSLQSEIERYLDKNYIKKIEEKLQPVFVKARDEFYKVASAKIEKIYKSTIDEFYGNYNPKFYERRENSGLYNLLTIKTNDDELTWDFNPSVMTYRKDEDGNVKEGTEDGLYDLVFRKGYHGGSMYDNQKGLHPNPGVPYWRTPEPHYRYWGRPAIKDSISPLENFNKKMYEYQNNGECQRDFDTIVAAKLNKAASNIWR